MENYYYITEEDYKKAEKNGVSRTLLYQRTWHGWSKRRAINTPPIPKLLNKEHFKKAEEIGVSRLTLQNRVYKLGWDIEKACSTPVIQKDTTYTEIAKKNNINLSTYRSRVAQGWSKELACTVKTNTRKQCIEKALATRNNKNVKVVDF